MKNPQVSRFRELLNAPGIIRGLGVHDAFTALVAEQAGLETVFVGGFGSSASYLGLPDLGYMTLTEMASQMERISSRISVPLIADGDTGHGGELNVARTIKEFESAGASGVLLEDQVSPKRCGHFNEKEVIPAQEMVLKLKAALKSREDKNFALIARTDARAPLGLEEAIDRANRYGDTGADVVFIEAPESEKELDVICKKVRYPMLCNMLTGGKTPVLPVKTLEEMGFKIAVFPIDSLLVTAHAIKRLVETLKQEGRVDRFPDAISFEEVKALLGVGQKL